MTEQKEIYGPKNIFQTPETTWYENDIYIIRIYKDFVVVKPKNSEKRLFITLTGNVVFFENIKAEPKYLFIATGKQINLLE